MDCNAFAIVSHIVHYYVHHSFVFPHLPIICPPAIAETLPHTGSTVSTLDITNLQNSIHRYYYQGLALSTQRLYSTGQAHYHLFCCQLHCLPLPSTEHILLLFVAYLANEGLQLIKVYLSALHNLHVATGNHQISASQLMPRMEQVLHGIKQTQAS